MKNWPKYIVYAISVLLTLVLIFDAFADDEHYKKRHRYRAGSQKNNDDNKVHDRDNYLKPVSSLTYKETCGGCHFAYQPELLPSASWQKILNQLYDHFGDEVETEPDTIKGITDYLIANGAESSSAKISVQIMRSLRNGVPSRITEIPCILKKHRELDPAVFERESIGSLANCTACHITAEKGIYDDDAVKIPN